MKKFLSVTVTLLLLLTLTSCNDYQYKRRVKSDRSQEFRFDIEILELEEYSYSPIPSMGDEAARFAIRVTTTYAPNDPELFTFDSAHAKYIVGGHPTIILPDGSELKPVIEDIPYTEYGNLNMGSGDFTAHDWNFAIPRGFVWGK